MLLAEKLCKLPVPAVEMNKQCINRAYELGGMLEAIRFNEEMFAEIQMSPTEESQRFFEVANEKGLAAAFKWRDELFAARQE